MRPQDHSALAGFIWNIANKLRGPYRPPQYRKVMLPLVVLRRLDLVLEPTKEQVLAEHTRLEARGSAAALEDLIENRDSKGYYKCIRSPLERRKAGSEREIVPQSQKKCD